MIALIKDDVLVTVNTLELVGIVYLAIAVSYLRERISRMEGRSDQRNHDDSAGHGPPS